MKISVKMFAAAREAVGSPEASVELALPAAIGDLRAALAEKYPDLAHLLPRALFAVNSVYVKESAEITATAEVACIPPVSGG